MKTSRLSSAPPPTPTRQAHRSGPILGRWLRLLTALLALVTMSAPAAITLDPSPSSSVVNGAATLSWTHTVGSGTNRVLVVCVSTEKSPEPTVSSVKFQGVDLIQLPGARAVGITYNATDMWYMLNPPTVVNGTILVTLSGTASTWGSAVSFSGAQQAAPEASNALGQAATTPATGSYSLTLNPVSAGALVVDVVNNGTAAAAAFAATGPNMVVRADSATSNHRSASSTRAVSAAGSVTNTWTTNGTSRMAHSMASFAAAATGTPPTVTLTAPTGAYSGTAPATVNFAATASDSDGTVTKVEFFQGTTKVGEDLTAPYTFAWTNVAAGTYSLTAKATDDLGNTTTSTPAVSITVSADPNAPTIALTSPAANATGIGTSTNLQVAVSDPTVPAQALTVTYYGRKTTPATPGPDFTLMTIPDTQFYSENTGRLGGAFITIFNAQTQWMVDNRVTRNIAFVSHMGDIVQNGDGIQAEWDNADGAMKLIENQLTTLRAFGIPWGGAPGNHDYGPAGGGSGTTAKYNNTFGTARFTGRNYYGGNYGTNNNNNYQLFRASGLDFIAIHLEYQSGATPQAILDWANALLQAYPNRRGIVTSHWTLNTGNPATFSTQGTAIYNALKGNKNLFLMLGGHVNGEGRRTEVFNGHTVYASLQDYQDLPKGGNGFLRIFTFSPANNNIVTETWSPTLNRAATTADHASALGTYTLAWTNPDVSPLQGSLTDWIPLGTVNVAAGGTSASLPWTGLEKGGDYEWFATVSDGTTTVSSTSRRFSTTANLAPTVAITSPPNNDTILAPGSVTLTADAADADGSIVRVEFYQGATKLGEDTTAPYTWPVAGLAVGSYTFSAVSVDNSGTPTNPNPGSNTSNASLSAAATLSSSVNLTVAAAAPSSGTLTRGPYLNSASHDRLTVRWRSSSSIVGRVRYGTAVGNLNQTVNEASAQTNHVVTLTGLTPYTRYYYSVGSAFDTLTPQAAETTSYTPGAPAPTAADYTFRTAPTPGTAVPTRVWIVGDCGRGTQAQANARNGYYPFNGGASFTSTTSPGLPDLNLQMGDNAYNSGTDAEYTTGYFNIYANIFRKMPQWSCLGNHDANNGSTDPLANFPYFDMFTFPTAGECGGVASGTEHYYSFNYGNIHFIALDSQASNTAVDNPATPGVNEDGPMAAWLRADLASVTATWIVAYWHHPSYSKGSHNSDTEGQLINMRTNFLPILEAGGVDVCYVGHSHNYERSVLLDGNYLTSAEPTAPSPSPTVAMKKNAGNGSIAGFTTVTPGTIRNAANSFTATSTVNGTFIPGNGAYIKPLTGPRDHFGAVYNTAGMSGSADSNSINHPAMYVCYNTMGTVNLDINGNTLTSTFVTSSGATPDNFTITKQGASDSDGDGISDAYEIANGLNRFNAADAALDSDGDGSTNLQEYAFSTAANTATSRYTFSTAYDMPVAGQATVTFPTATGRTYRVLYSANLLSWQPASGVVTGTGAAMQWFDDGTATGSLPSVAGKRFYRIEVTVVP